MIMLSVTFVDFLLYVNYYYCSLLWVILTMKACRLYFRLMYI